MLAYEERGAQHSQAAANAPAPVRGTQSFVGVMVAVWNRPGLTALELLWRWSAGAPLLTLAAWTGARALHGVRLDWNALQGLTIFKPAEAAETLTSLFGTVFPPLWPVLRWFVPLAVAVWAVAATLGRSWIWRRLDRSLQPRPGVVGALTLIRSVALLAFFAIWIWGLWAAGRYAITTPAHMGGEPNLVLYTALAVGLTLLLFMLWSLTVWVLDAAPLFAMRDGLSLQRSLRAACRAGALRSRLQETNLVMGIVKVSLLVLAMVFSASPLPFSSVETTTFLVCWWIFVAVVYLAFCDLFQVVRRAAYLAFVQTSAPPVLHDGTQPEAGRKSRAG